MQFCKRVGSWKRWSLSAVLALGIMSALAVGQQTAIPSKEAQAKAHALILEIFKDDLAQASDSKDGAAKSKLAAVLLQQGRESKDKDEAANRYMLYQMAADLAAQAGDAPLALTAVDELARAFPVQALELKVAVLLKSGKHTISKEANKALVDLILPMIGDAVDADDYEVALKLSQVALEAAKKSKNLPLVTAVQKRDLEVRAVQKGFAHLKPFVDRLKKDPKDAEANFELGKYFALLKGKWERALPLLAMGSDETLKAQARADLAAPKEGKGQLALADAWWNLADKEKDPAKLNLQVRAKVWYEKAVLNLAGLNRTKALRRLEQINARLEGVAVIGLQGPIGELKKFEGHTDEIKGVAFSSDGRYAASGGLDQTVRNKSCADTPARSGRSSSIPTIARCCQEAGMARSACGKSSPAWRSSASPIPKTSTAWPSPATAARSCPAAITRMPFCGMPPAGTKFAATADSRIMCMPSPSPRMAGTLPAAAMTGRCAFST